MTTKRRSARRKMGLFSKKRDKNITKNNTNPDQVTQEYPL